MVCHVLVSRICVLQVPWDIWLLVESVVFPTEPPPGAQGVAANSLTGGWAAQNLDLQALRIPYLCEKSVLCV